MKRKIKKKLRSRAGESIGETLVALLIASLAMLMLAGAVQAGVRVVTRSKTAMDAYYTANNSVVQSAGSASTGTIELKNGTTGIGLVGKNIQVNYNINDFFSATPVISYKYIKPTT